MKTEDFRHHAHELVDWIADYLEHADRYPVCSRSRPGDLLAALPASPPEEPEPMADVLADFRRDVLPGITHWNHPRFFAYFPANNSGPSILGEMLSAGLGVNGMLWQTSPAATELEQRTLEWLAQLVGLPAGFHGVIHDTASTATFCALVCARERTTGFAANAEGLGAATAATRGPLRVYASREAHSSVLKGARLAGFGAANVVSVAIDAQRRLDPADLERLIAADRAAGKAPCAVVATVGTTGCTAVDPLASIGPLARRHGLWLHVDAALAGAAAILPSMRWLLDGVEHADSLVFNPHKWLLVNFDCSAFYVRDPDHLQRAMAIHPEYLRTTRDAEVVNYMDWGLQLGRRFRALKLWFVLRTYGARQLRAFVAAHLELAQEFAGWVEATSDWELLAPVPLNTVCFRWRPAGVVDEARLNELNAALMARVNAEGTVYLTHTKLDDVTTLRLAVGQRATTREHVQQAWAALQAAARDIAEGEHS
ncbi:MAG: aminotransferase class V-fold PLP-dependent enzyme [bacterium]|nr:aminotransferase class V-fold PLP-dependent enzyme [bacterium]